MIRRVLLVGAGAIGMLHAVKLARNGEVELKLFADAARRRRYLENGLFFNGEKINFDFADMVFEPELIVVATKFCQYREALEMIAPYVRKNTILMPVLNGISSADVARERFPETEVVTAFFLGHASVRTGTRVFHDGVGTTYLGLPGSPASAAVAAIKDLFDAVGISAEVPADMRAALWKKFILNVGVNQTSAFFRADYGTIQKNHEMLDFARQLMLEALEIARRENVDVSVSAVEEAMKVICTMPACAKTSMLQDVEAKRETEIGLFAGELLRRAEKYQLDLPANRKVWEKLKPQCR